jgi:sphinganine-1-phosphate aldolase
MNYETQFDQLKSDFLSIASEADKVVIQVAQTVNQNVNSALKDFSPLQLLILGAFACYVLARVWEKYEHARRTGIYVMLFRFVTKLPGVNSLVAAEEEKTRQEYAHKYTSIRPNTTKVLPLKGTDTITLLKSLQKGESLSKKFYKDGAYMSGAVYIDDDEHWNFVSEVMRMFIVTNPLHIEEFAPVLQMEAEIIRIICNLYHGDENSVGIVTSGGTESIMLAMLAYREKGLAERGITHPNIVCSETAHAAFDKAGFYFGIEVRKVPLTKDVKFDIRAMSKAIDSNTVCLVASAPEFAYGNYDPVE